MNTYEIRITNVNDDSDFHTLEVESSNASSVMDIVKSGYASVADVEFEANGKFIVIFEASDEGYMYDIYASKTAYDNDEESLDGGQCTSTLSNAIEMALSQA